MTPWVRSLHGKADLDGFVFVLIFGITIVLGWLTVPLHAVLMDFLTKTMDIANHCYAMARNCFI